MRVRIFDFFVPGTPRPQGSAKWIRSRTTGKSIPAKNKNLETWRGVVSVFAYNAMQRDEIEMTDGAVGVSLVFQFERPKNHFRTGKYSHEMKPSAPPRHLKTPDIDKLIRAVLDSLTGVLYHDDSQVDSIIATKGWGPRAGVDIIVRGEKNALQKEEEVEEEGR